MKFSVGLGKEGVEERLQRHGISRRDFMKFCTTVAVAMGLGTGGAFKVAEALAAEKKPSVVWLHFAECTGCSESVLRAVDPDIGTIILDVLSIDYHETIMAAAGDAAEKALHQATHAGDYICVVEGGIPTGENGIYGTVARKKMIDIAKEIVPGAKATIAIGNCACFGGVQKAAPNPTAAVSVSEATGVTTVNIAGCPPNPVNFVGAVVHFLTKGLPELDGNNRPTLFYGETVHDNCPRLKHFEAGEFAPSFASEEARKGWCLYELGCRGPETFNNCPKVLFNQTSFPIQAGHGCIGCSEPSFWDNMSPFYM